MVAINRKKHKNALSVFIATDSEWDNARPDVWLSTAFAACDKKPIIYINPNDVPGDASDRMEAYADANDIVLVWVRRHDESNLLADAIRRFRLEDAKEIGLQMFYSPKDLEYAVGVPLFNRAIWNDDISQRNNISGTIDMPGHKIRVRDIKGWASKQSLLGFALSLGLDFPSKTMMDGYKSHMFDGMLEHPEDFLKYSVADAIMTSQMYFEFVELYREVQRDCLDMDGEDLWTAGVIPMTVGALVARTLERWIAIQTGDIPSYEFALRKLGILDRGCRSYYRNQEAWLKVVDSVGSLAQYRKIREYPSRELTKFLKAKYQYTALDSCTVTYWAGRGDTESSAYNALVQGGRCGNEIPAEYRTGPGADIDLAGCYGSALRTTIYPIGLPCLWSFSPNQQPMTLGKWLDTHGEELVDGLWSATVSGDLNFDQDLIHSKMVGPNDIRKASKDQENPGDIPSDFCLLRREIRNGVITSENLRVIKAVATTPEWGQFRDLKLVTATGYLAGDRKDDFDSWCDAVIRNQGEYSSFLGGTRDDRCRAWWGIPLEGFLGRLCDRRKHYKRLKTEAPTEDERKRSSGMDATLKLIVNTVYGCLASRHFPIGNTTLANNITAKARTGVWMLAKSLRLRQSITDGGIYTPSKVCFFDGTYRKPGIDVFSRPAEWHAPNRKRWLRPMEGHDTQDIVKLDRHAFDHNAEFWKPYGLTFPFGIEHKDFFSAAAYIGKSDYVLLENSGRLNFKLRGKNPKVEKRHPSYELLQSIVEGKDDFPEDHDYLDFSLMSISKYKQVQACGGYLDLKNLRPGDEVNQVRTARYNNTHFPMFTSDDYYRRRNRKKVHRGSKVQWFEKHAEMGIEGVIRKMEKDDLK